MSRKRKTCHSRNHELENERRTRKSARLNNPDSISQSKSEILERKKITRLQRTSPVFTRSRRRFISCNIPYESTGTDENDSDLYRSIVKNLTYSSSDNNDWKTNIVKSSKGLSHNYSQNQLLNNNRKNVDDGKTHEKARTDMSHKAILRSVTDEKSYNLRRRTPPAAKNMNEKSTSASLKCVTNQNEYSSRKCTRTVERDDVFDETSKILRNVTNPKSCRRRSPRFADSGSETPNENTKKVTKTNAKETKNESNKTPSVVDMPKPKAQALKQLTCMPSSIIRDQEKDVKKAKVKKKGTLARKRELRAMLEKQDEGYEDDAFDGTPFKNRKSLLKCKLSPVVLNTSIQSINTDYIQSTDSESFKTPCSKTPVNRLRPSGPLSSGTSESDIMTPGLLNTVNRYTLGGAGQTHEKARTDTSRKAISKSYNLRRTPPAAKNMNEKSTSASLKCVTNKNKHSSRNCPRTVERDDVFVETSKILSLRNSTNPKSNRRRSPHFADSGSETPNENTKKVTKRKAKETKNESNKTPSVVDMPKPKAQALKQFTCMPSSIIRDQEKDVKKAKVKKKGTLARKRELRAMLEKQDEGYEDDAFDGTPFKNRKSLLKCKLSPVVLNTSMQSINTDYIQSTDSESFKTPCSKTPVNRLRPSGPLSSGTSESDIMTPGLLNTVNRKDIDCYVNQLKRRNIRLRCNTKMKIKSHTPLISKKYRRIVPSKSFDFTNILKKSTTESENCEDYYWSDIE